MSVTRMVRWIISLLAVALVSVVAVQQLIKRLHYGTGDNGVYMFSTNLGRRGGSRTWEVSSRGVRRI